jgi:hypothetical protein
MKFLTAVASASAVRDCGAWQSAIPSVEQKFELTDLSTQVTAVMLSELLKYETDRMFSDFSLNMQVFTLKDLHTSTFTDSQQCR